MWLAQITSTMPSDRGEQRRRASRSGPDARSGAAVRLLAHRAELSSAGGRRSSALQGAAAPAPRRARRTAARRRCRRARDRPRARDAASARARGGSATGCRRCRGRAVGIGDVAEGDAVLALEPGERRRRRRSSCRRGARSAGGSPRRGRSRAVKALSAVATASGSGVADEAAARRCASARRAAGPVSISTWKPLQTPSDHGRRLPAKSTTAPHDRRAGRDGAAAQVVAEGEAARHRRRGRAPRAARSPCARPSPPRRRRAQRHREVAVAVRAGEDDDAGAQAHAISTA